MIQTIAPQMCPECGHHSSGIQAGGCTAFVPNPDGPPWAGYCGCGCYDRITGRVWRDDWAAAMAPPPTVRRQLLADLTADAQDAGTYGDPWPNEDDDA